MSAPERRAIYEAREYALSMAADAWAFGAMATAARYCKRAWNLDALLREVSA